MGPSSALARASTAAARAAAGHGTPAARAASETLRREAARVTQAPLDWNEFSLTWPSKDANVLSSKRNKWECFFHNVNILPKQYVLKAEALIEEAKEKGNLRELMNLPVTDPRHPFYYEHPWTVLEKNPHLWNQTSLGKFRKHRMDIMRTAIDLDMVGILTDDVADWKLKATSEALFRVSTVELVERQRRLTRGMEFSAMFETLPESDWLHPDEDVAYLTPHIIMVINEMQESGLFGGDWN